MYDIFELNEKSLVELKDIAINLGIENYNLPKEEVVYKIADKQQSHSDIITKMNNETNENGTSAVPESAEKPQSRPGRKRKIATSNPESNDNEDIIGSDEQAVEERNDDEPSPTATDDILGSDNLSILTTCFSIGVNASSP